MKSRNSFDIRTSRPAQVVVAILAILGLVLAVAPAALSQNTGPDRFRAAIVQVGADGTVITEANPLPLGVGDGGPLNGGGALNLRYRIDFTCDVPMPGKSTCEGAQIVMKIPDVSYRWDSDLPDGGDGRLLQPPTFELGTGSTRYFDYVVDEVNRTVTLTVRPGWLNTSATGYINFPTSVHASIPGAEEFDATITYGDTTRTESVTAYTYGEPKPNVSKGIISNDNTYVRPGEIFEYTLRANRDKTAGTQAMDGVLVDTLPKGLKFLGFKEVAGATSYTLRNTGETLRVEPSYDDASREIRISIPEDYAAHYVRTNGLGINVVVQVEDSATLRELGVNHLDRIVNKVDFDWESIDDEKNGIVSSEVARRLWDPSVGGAGTQNNYKKQHGVNSAVTENAAMKSFELYFSNPTNGADLKVTDLPTPWSGDDRVILSPYSMELRTFPKEYYQKADGTWDTRDPQGSTMTYFFSDGSQETVSPRTSGGWLVYDNPRRGEYPQVRVTKTELNFPNAPMGRYQFVARTDGVINRETPETYRAENCMQYEINGEPVRVTQNAKQGDPFTSCVNIPVAQLKADPWVAIGDGPSRETFTADNDNILARLNENRADGLQPISVSFGLFNNNPLAGAASPVTYLTTPAGLKLNPDSLKWRDSNPDVNGKCTIRPEDLTFEEVDEPSPNGGRKYRVVLNPDKFADGLPINTDPAASGLANCGIAVQVLRDTESAAALIGGPYTSADLTERLSGIAITVMEESQSRYIQSKVAGLTDTYGVIEDSQIPAGVEGAPKIHQEVYTFNIPAVNARVVRKSVKGDRDTEFKEQINWNTWNKEFAINEGDEPGFWDSVENRDNSLAVAERTVEYKISGGTEGTIPLTSATIYDFLPSNDNLNAGSLTGSSYENGLDIENGKYPENGMIPTLAGAVKPETIDPSKVRILYSRSTNPCRPDLPGVDSNNCDPNWLTESEIGTDWASVKVIRIDFIEGVDRVHDFSYTMNMPPKPIRDDDGLRRSDIAYNQVTLTSTMSGGTDVMEPLGPFAAAVRYVPAVRVDKQIEEKKGTPDRELLDTPTVEETPIYVEGDEVNYILKANNQSKEYVAEGVRVIDRLPSYLEFTRAELIDAQGNVIRELPTEQSPGEQAFISIGSGDGFNEYAWVVGDVQPDQDLHLRVVSTVRRINDVNDDFVIVPNYANIITEDQWRDYDGVLDTECAVNVGYQDDCDVVNAQIDLRKGAISGTYFRDVQAEGEGSGIIDAEDKPMAGQKVVLHYDWSEGKPYPFLDENGEPLRNEDGSIKTTMETTTDAQGNYSFTGLVHGTYWVEFETRAGLPFVEPNVGNDPLIDSDAVEEIDGNEFKKRTANIELGVGDNLPGYNAGVYGQKATIEGTFWFDKDEDGLEDAQAGEVIADEALTGGSATVELLLDGKVIETQTTSDGTYSFPGLDAGNYEVRVTNLPDGWRITDNPVGKEGNLVEAEVDDDTVGSSGTIELDWAMTAERDVPIVNTASLAGVVYREDDRDGQVAPNAPTVAGAIVYLLDENGERVTRDGQPVTAVTGPNGSYKFANLAPGTYGVEIVPPTGYVLSAQAGSIENLDAAHLSDVAPSTGKLTGIELSGSENQVNVDAVVNNRLTISGVVVNDANADGLLDEGEGRYANIQVILTDENGNEIEGIAPVQTDNNGAYSFTDIPARTGGYQVKFVKPNGTVISPVQTGQDITEEGRNDANAEGVTRTIAAVAGQDKPNVDAYINNLGSISGHFYLESDTNGIVQAGDPRISGVVVSTMVGEEEVFAKVNEDGTFIFEQLPAGEYDLKFSVPSGYRISTTAGSEQNLTDGLRNDVSANGTVTGVPVTAGNTTENVDLVVHPIGSVAGTVFVEPDKDGNADNQTGTLANVKVELLNAAGEVVAETTTNAQGDYRFDNVVAGAGYQVRIVTPEGYNLSTLAGGENITEEDLNDFAPATRTTAAFEVTGGQSVDNVDAVVHQFGGISGRIVIEENTDGRIGDNETVAGASVTVRLLDSEGNPVTDVNGVAITTQTDENGNYSFAGLPAGEYQVAFDKPEALRFSPTTGGEDVTQPNLNDFAVAEGTSVATSTVTVTVNQTTNNVDAIMYGVGGVSGRMIALPNDSGTVTENVTPVPLGDQTVTLKLEDGGELTTTTNADGTYVFENVPAGDHTVVFPTVTGYTFSNKTGGDDVNEANLNDADPESREISVTVPRDGQVVNADAILHGDTSISGIYFNDFDNDGTRDAGDDTIEGVRVELLDAAGNVIATTTTGDNGEYKFDHLVGEQDYQVRFITPQGMAISPVPGEATDSTNDAAAESGRTDASRTETVRPTADAPVTNLNGAATSTALLTGTVFDDANRDGRFDEGESGREGVTVRLLDKNGNPVEGVEPVQTDADGNYSFRVPAGEYRVEVVAPENEAITKKNEEAGAISEPGYSDVASTTGRTAVITVGAGQTVNTIDAGIVTIDGSISGTVTGERDSDGDATGDQPTMRIPGATVKLIKDGEVIETVTTDENGDYTFTGVAPGTYTVDVDLPQGWAHSTQIAKELGSRVNGDEDKSVVNDQGIVEVVLATNENKTNVDAVANTSQSISGIFFDDVNGDGVQDSGDQPVAGVTVELLDAEGNVVESTTTDANGAYSFTNVFPGTYSVRFVHTDDAKTITRVAADQDDAATNDAAKTDDKTGVVSGIVVQAGEDNSGIDAGYTDLPGSISGTIFNDDDRDGALDEGETGIAGTKVELVKDGQVIAEAIADENGFYRFEGVQPGDYQVHVVTEGNEALTAKDLTTPGHRNVTVTSQEETKNHDFGFVPSKAVISGTVFNDEDRNGVFDGEGDNAEQVREGVTVNLINPESGEVVATTTTDENGAYRFEVEAGSYQVQVVAPEAEEITPKSDSAPADLTAENYSDVDASGKTPVFTVVPGQNMPHVDAGLTNIDAAISGTVYGERDDDGDVTDSDEPSVPVPGATVELLNEAGEVVATTTTDAAGAYAFGTQRPGLYSIRMALPAGWAFSAKAANALETEKQSFVDDVTENEETRVQSGVIEQFELLSDSDRINIDAVAHSRANVSGVFFDDVDANGVRDEGEDPLDGITVELLDENGNVVEETTTDSKGAYEFTNVFPGTYSVRFSFDDTERVITPVNPEEGVAEGTNNAERGETPQVGTTEPFDVEPGQSVDGVDAASTDRPIEAGAISGTIWNDVNEDGEIAGTGEGRIEGVTVELINEDGDVVATVTTDDQGNYSFTEVAPGEYTIRVVAPEGYDQTSDPVRGTAEPGLEVTVTVEEGETTTAQDFGFVETPETPVEPEPQPGSVTGTVWNDNDEDQSIGNGEGGIADVTVELVDSEGNVVATTTTNSRGDYSFEDVEAGEYTVRVNTDDSAEQLEGKNATTVTSRDITVEEGKPSADHNFGYVAPAEDPVIPADPETRRGVVTGTVFRDADESKTLDEGETGISGVTVELVDSNGEVVASKETTIVGSYVFENVEPGEYTVRVVNDSDPLDGLKRTTAESLTVTVVEDGLSDNNDFGFFGQPAVEPEDPEPTPVPGRVSGITWVDRNKDGRVEAEEIRLAGVTVVIYDGNGNRAKDLDGKIVEPQVTDAEGKYSFDNLAPGEYVVKVENAPQDYMLVSDWNMTDGVSGTAVVRATTDSEEATSYDFGFATEDEEILIPAAVAAGRIFEDLDRDAVHQEPEAGIAGIVVTLTNKDSGETWTDTTDEFGSYSFDSLAPGNYEVSFEFPDGFAEQTGNPDGVVSAQSLTYEFVLDANDVRDDLDFGFVKPDPVIPVDPVDPVDPEDPVDPVDPEDPIVVPSGKISGTVVIDEDGNGKVNEGDTPLEGYTVILYGENGEPIHAVKTDADGHYEFTGLPAGNYTLSVVDPTGYEQTFNPPEVVLPENGSVANRNFGYVMEEFADEKGSVGGRVVIDVDGNGRVSGPDIVLEGYTVILRDADGKEIARTTTGADGRYSFGELDPGKYSLEVVAPNGSEPFFEPESFTLEAGENKVDKNFGFIGEDTPGSAKPGGLPEGVIPIILSLIAGGTGAAIVADLPSGSSEGSSTGSSTGDAPEAPADKPAPEAPAEGSAEQAPARPGQPAPAPGTGKGEPSQAQPEQSDTAKNPVERVLAETGANVAWLIGFALAFILLGFIMLMASRRRDNGAN